MANHQADAVVVPLPHVAVHEVAGFLGKIRVVDEKVLAECDVGPEHGKRKHEFAHDMIVLNRC